MFLACGGGQAPAANTTEAAQADPQPEPAADPTAKTGEPAKVFELSGQGEVTFSDPVIPSRFVVLAPEKADELGRFIVVDPQLEDDNFFFGNAETLYRLPVRGYGAEKGADGIAHKLGLHIVTRNVRRNASDLSLKDGKWEMACEDRKTAWKAVDDETKATLFKSAQFMEQQWRKSAYGLARDDSAVYYYVERSYASVENPDIYRPGSDGFRLFVGKAGEMKQTELKNVANDSAGLVFATKTGDLRFVLKKAEASFTKRKRTKKLTYLEPRDNVYLIYNELGVYEGESFGTPCDFY